jgi:hypothetical protein
MASDTYKLIEFVQAMLRRDDVAEGSRLHKVVVSHIVRGNKIGDEILTITVPQDPPQEWIENKAAQVLEQAGSEAVTLGTGPQTYAIHAYFSGEEKSRGRHVFTVVGANEEEGTISTEGPDAEGLVALSMNMARDFAHLGTAGIKWQLKALLEENERLRQTLQRRDQAIEGMQMERLKSIKVLEELQTMAVERDLRVRREQLKERILDQAADKFSVILPMVVNHLAGKKIFPETAANTLALKSFGESLKKEDFGVLQRQLSPEQYGLLIQVLTSVSKTADEPTPSDGEPNSLAEVSPATLRNGAAK